MAREIRSIEHSLRMNVAWNGARINLVARLLAALMQVKTVNLAQLASVLESEALVESSYKRLQRFFRYFRMPYDELAVLLVKMLGVERPWVITVDRTEWHGPRGKHNVLVVGIAYKGAAIPVMFRILPKIGTSSFDERQAMLDEYLKLFGVDSIRYLTADREFTGRRFYQYLYKHGIRFCLRIRKDTPVGRVREKAKKMGHIIGWQTPGVKCRWRKRQVIWNVPVKVATLRLNGEWLAIAASPDLNADPFSAYSVRWEIETCFGFLKSKGFCLESTRLIDPGRLKCLIGVMALAYSWAIKTGEWVTKKYPTRIQSHGRASKSMFRVGLDCLRGFICRSRKSYGYIIWKDIARFLSCT